MLTKIQHYNLTWINLISPSAKEIDDLAKEFPIQPLIAEELTSLTMRSKADVHPENLYFVLHFPSADELESNAEIDFLIGENFLITSQYQHFTPIEKFLKNAYTKEEFRQKNMSGKPIALAFKILTELYETSLHQLDQIHIKAINIERLLFNGNEKENVKNISMLKRDILDFKRAFYLHEDILRSLEKTIKKNNHKGFFEKDSSNRLISLIGEFEKIKSTTESNKEFIETLYETNESLLTNKTNEAMKILSIMAFITFPLMLLSSIFGMNTVSTPLVGTKGDFWIITAAMVMATFGMFIFFKHKKWL